VKKKKPAKKKKDKDAPKGAMSAFMYFSQDQRASVKEAQPELTLGGVAKVCSAPAPFVRYLVQVH